MPTVLITGVSGYIAGWLAKKLSDRADYKIRGTVRDLSSEEKVKHIRQLLPQVELVEADLVKPGSFDKAVEGVEIIFHTASPFQLNVSDPQRDLVDPAVNGTLNVLHAAEKSPSVKRVVLTSSVAAVVSNVRLTTEPNHVFSEADWNTTATIEKEAYRYSKTKAEQAAWDFVKGKHFDLVVINPSFVLGPPLSARTDSTSVGTVKGFLDGSKEEGVGGPFAFGAVDVRDVADAHIAAAEKKTAHGRYLVTTERGVPPFELVQLLKKSGKFDHYKLPKKESVKTEHNPHMTTKKAREELGIHFTPLEKTVVDMAEALIALGIVQKQ